MKIKFLIFWIILVTGQAFASEMPFTFYIENNDQLSTKDYFTKLNSVLLSPMNASKNGEVLNSCQASVSSINVEDWGYFFHASLVCPEGVSNNEIVNFITKDMTEESGMELTPSLVNHN